MLSEASFEGLMIHVDGSIIDANQPLAEMLGYALGRDYEGMDDVLLVAVTEKKTVEDVDRLADVLAEVCA